MYMYVCDHEIIRRIIGIYKKKIPQIKNIQRE
jgi:hypothetical protein